MMKSRLMATVTGFALLFGAASFANAADSIRAMPGAATESQSLEKAVPDQSYKYYQKDFTGLTVPGGLSPDDLIGAKVVNASGENIGEIEDLVVGPDKRAYYAMVEVGDFLGIGSKFIAVDINKLKANPNGTGFMYPMTKDQLENNAAYEEKEGHWRRNK